MAKAVAAPVGALAKARKFAQDKRKEEFDNVRVKMSLEDMNESLPHVSSGSVVVDHLIGGIANSFGVAPCPGFPRGRVSQLWGHESAGKCLPADTYVQTPDGLLTVGELFVRQGLEPVSAVRTTEASIRLFNRSGVVENTTHFTHNGHKTTYSIQTFSGGSVRSTANHPHLVMGPDGFWTWKQTCCIVPGDYMLVARKFDAVPTPPTPLELSNRAYSLGIDVASNCLSGNHPRTATLGLDVRSFTIAERTAFLQGYFDHAGSIDHHAMVVNSDGRGILDGIRLLLQTYGIVGLLRPKTDNTESWCLRLTRADVGIFAHRIGTRSGTRAGQLEAFLFQPQGDPTNHDMIPHVGGLLQSLYDSVTETTHQDSILMGDYMGTMPRAGLTYPRLETILETFNGRGDKGFLNRLREIRDAGYYYDRVESVSENEPEPTFDFAMSETASFIANGFVTHNTTLALSVAAQVCKEGGSVLYVDWENDIVPDYAMALGVPVTDENKFELLQPDNLEDGIKYALIYAAAGVDLIVFDSVGAAIPRRLTERDLNDAAEQGKVGEVQAVWSQELPNLKRLIARSGTAVIGISQIRAEIGKMGHGPQTKPQGGNAWKFYSSVRLELRRVQYENAKEMNTLTHKVEDKVSGSVVKVKAVKCKMSRSQGREEIFYLRGGHGIDNIRSILEIAIAHGMIKKSGAWITWVKPDGSAIKVQGIEKLRQHMVDTPTDYVVLDSIVRPLLGSGESTKQFVEDEDYEPVVGEDEPATGGLSMDEELGGIFDSDA